MRDDADLLSKTTVTFMEQLRRLRRVYVKQKPLRSPVETAQAHPQADSVGNVEDKLEGEGEEKVEEDVVKDSLNSLAVSKGLRYNNTLERSEKALDSSKGLSQLRLRSVEVEERVESESPSKSARDRFLQDLVSDAMPGLVKDAPKRQDIVKDASKPQDAVKDASRRQEAMPGLVKDVPKRLDLVKDSPRRHDAVKTPRKPSFKTRRVEALASKYNLLDTGSTPRVVVGRKNSNTRRPAVTVRRVSHVMAAIERFEQAGDAKQAGKDLKQESKMDVREVKAKDLKVLVKDSKFGTNKDVKDSKIKDSKQTVGKDLKLGVKDAKTPTKSDYSKTVWKINVNNKPNIPPKSDFKTGKTAVKSVKSESPRIDAKPKPGMTAKPAKKDGKLPMTVFRAHLRRVDEERVVKEEEDKVSDSGGEKEKVTKVSVVADKVAKKDLLSVSGKDKLVPKGKEATKDSDIPKKDLFSVLGGQKVVPKGIEVTKDSVVADKVIKKDVSGGQKSVEVLKESVDIASEPVKEVVYQANKSGLFAKTVESADDDYEIVEAGTQEIRANTSFLWGLVQHSVAANMGSALHDRACTGHKGRLPDVPLETARDKGKLPDVPDNEDDIELSSDQEDGTYDDIHPPSEHYSSLDNIYDDVGNLAVEPAVDKEGSYDGSLRGYEYVGSDRNIYACVKSETVSNCYESISLYASDAVSRNNSLYGGIQPITGSGSDVNYHQPRSDTSDEWVDLELSDTEVRRPNHVVSEKPARMVARSPSWSQRVRRQWSSRSPRRPRPESSVYVTSSSAVYFTEEATTNEKTDGGESTNQLVTLRAIIYDDDGGEMQEVTFFLEKEGSESDSHHYEVLYEVSEPRDIELPFDDFDSSEDENAQPYNGRLPQPPPAQNIYAISKMAATASSKLMQLRKSLSRIRVKRTSSERLRDGPLSLPLPDKPDQPLDSTTQPLESAKQPLEATKQPATATDNSQHEQQGRKYWSLRKFRRSRSQQMSSTFYLTETLDLDSKTNSDTSNERLNDTTNSGATTTNNDAPPARRNSSVRPTSPPPLPPGPKRPERKEKRSQSATSWYAECGLFEAKRSSRPLTSSWYADVGLWEENSTVPDSSQSSPPESSASSSGSEQRFIDEPLYQFYAASVVERDLGYDETDSDGVSDLNVRPTAMQLVPSHGQHRTLWCEIPEVINSGVLGSLSSKQKKLQEARFEILASQASYVKSLGVLMDHFVASPLLADLTVLSKSDARILFGNVAAVRQCARRLLSRLEQCWQRSFLLADICDVIFDHATRYYNAYVKYCCNQIYLDRTLRRLKNEQGRFLEALGQLESNAMCESLSLHSFLMLPMQRITRLPLLLDAVLTRLEADSAEYHSCARSLQRLNQVVKECNEGARRMERMEEMLILSQRLDFTRGVKPVAVISSARWLVRSGEMTQLTWRGEEKMTFGRKFTRTQIHVFLFTDLLLIAKKKSEESYSVTDYCPRNLVQLSTEAVSSLPVKMQADAGRNPMLLTLLGNHDNKTVEMVVSCALESDRQRWLSAVQQPASDNPDESVYEQWDCPQVAATHSFTAAQPDELALDQADVVNVLRKLADGWYYGERLRDGESGWFPANHTQEIFSAHVRARNLKQRYRLLALSGTFIDNQRRTK